MDTNIIRGQGVLTNSSDAYSVTLSVGDSALTDKAIYLVKCNSTNTTNAATLNVNSIGAKALYNNRGTVLLPGEFRSGSWYEVLYDATFDYFVVLNASSSADTGWIDLAGFAWLPSAIRPQYRIINRVIHFSGTVVVPLDNPSSAGNLLAYTSESSYSVAVGVTPYSAGSSGTGAVTVNAAGSIIFNKSVSVFSSSAHHPDKAYSIPYQIATRRLESDMGGDEYTYTAPILINVSSAGLLTIGTIYDAENFNGTGTLGSAPLRFLTSNVVAGDYGVDLRTMNTNEQTHSVTAASDLDMVALRIALAHSVTIDAGNPAHLGGFSFPLTGLKAFLS